MVQCDPVATIDISNFAARKPEVTQEIMTAASDIGFFRIRGVFMRHAVTALPSRSLTSTHALTNSILKW